MVSKQLFEFLMKYIDDRLHFGLVAADTASRAKSLVSIGLYMDGVLLLNLSDDDITDLEYDLLRVTCCEVTPCS